MNAIEERTEPLSPRVRRVLDTLHERVAPDLRGATDLQATAELLEHLFRGLDKPKPGAVVAYLVDHHGWEAAQAEAVGQMWRGILTLRQVQTGQVYPLFSGEIR